jgi:hypothetical protein
MTLRTSLWDPARDGDLSVWFEVYLSLRKQLNCEVYVIPDFDDVYHQQKYKRYPWRAVESVSLDPDGRVALYAESLVNIGMAGGTASLMYLINNTPFITFGNLNSQSPVSSSAFYKRSGFEIGTQPTWFGRRQRFDWLESNEVTADYIMTETLAVLSGV